MHHERQRQCVRFDQIDGFIVVPHNVRIAIRWSLLTSVENRALTEARSALGDRYDPAVSGRVAEWYLCALVLSEPVQKWLHANRRSMKDDVYPEDIKAIPIKLLTPKQQRPFIEFAKERHRLWGEIIALESRGFDKNGSLPIWDLVKTFRAANPKLRFGLLVHASMNDVIKIDQAFWQTPLRGLRAAGPPTSSTPSRAFLPVMASLAAQCHNIPSTISKTPLPHISFPPPPTRPTSPNTSFLFVE
jgi:hypothetical protein